MERENKIKVEKNTFVMAEEPAAGLTVQDLRLWLRRHTSENDLADAEAITANQTGWLAFDVDEYEAERPERETILKEINGWLELESELTERILCISKSRPELDIQINWGENVGTFYQIRPFMELYGYSDQNGWWIKSDDKEPG